MSALESLHNIKLAQILDKFKKRLYEEHPYEDWIHVVMKMSESGPNFVGWIVDSGTYLNNETVNHFQILNDLGGFRLQLRIFGRLNIVFGILSEERDKFGFFVFNCLDLKS